MFQCLVVGINTWFSLWVDKAYTVESVSYQQCGLLSTQALRFNAREHMVCLDHISELCWPHVRKFTFFGFIPHPVEISLQHPATLTMFTHWILSMMKHHVIKRPSFSGQSSFPRFSELCLIICIAISLHRSWSQSVYIFNDHWHSIGVLLRFILSMMLLTLFKSNNRHSGNILPKDIWIQRMHDVFAHLPRIKSSLPSTRPFNDSMFETLVM